MTITEIKNHYTMLRDNEQLVYLDSAATSLTPDDVIDAMDLYYTQYNANIARGVYALSEKATAQYEDVRDKVKSFINATSTQEVIFTSGTTASINMIAHGLAHVLTDEDHIAVSAAEHHANFIPWQRLRDGQHFDVLAITPEGTIDPEDFARRITPQTKILALSLVSNVLGTINPIKELIAHARAINPDIIVVIDGAQALPHFTVDVQDLDCDFLVFSAHKMLGPTGVGVLWGKANALEKLTPLFTGGEMIATVTCTTTTFAPLPHRLEAGTPNIAGVIGLGAAIDYLTRVDMHHLRAHDVEMMTMGLHALTETFGTDITIYGPHDGAQRSGVISFTYKNYHPHDIAAILDSEHHIALRAGNHCAMPLHSDILHVSATARASFYLYNDAKDIEKLLQGLMTVDHILGQASHKSSS